MRTDARQCVEAIMMIIHRLFWVVALAGLVWGPSVASATQLTLTWTDNAAGQASFVIERGPAAAGPFLYLGQNPPGITGYYDTTVTPGIIYCYRVAAFNDVGQSAYSSVACGSASIPPPVAYAFIVKKIGTGMGTVTSTPSGITCGTLCSAQYASGTIVLLTATPHPSSRFSGWSGGGCSGTSLCRVTVQAATTVTADFTKGRNK
jgi:hypothetical protein